MTKEKCFSTLTPGGKRYLGDKRHLPTGSQSDVVISRMWEWAEWADWAEQGKEAKVTLDIQLRY